jgi:hypothetical protein
VLEDGSFDRASSEVTLITCASVTSGPIKQRLI